MAKNTITWRCCEQEFSHEQMMAHLQEVHQIDPKTTKASKRMLSHMDGSDWYASVFEWTVGELKCTQTVESERSKNDPMRYL